jgi:hypothetical protein
VWEFAPGGVNVHTPIDYPDDEMWAREYAAEICAAGGRAEVRRRTVATWTGQWEPVV